ncbi:hemicentin-1-like [Ostrea edulis]|uniref:hemicentin-1-like n=1 Tax=Ostrea edulis TaxID=37623 RepID=UPI0024AFAB71|nr:hemicentin-1-like [Ostrea edulis]
MARERRYSLLLWMFVFFLDVLANPQCASKGDMVFLLDESGSIGSTNFERVKTFVNSVISNFQIGTSATQISVVTFHSSATQIFQLNRYLNIASLQSAISSISFNGGGTDIGDALDYARSQSFQTSSGARTDSAKIVILITDGQSSISNQADLLKAIGVTIFCVGVGSGVNSAVLRSVSTHNDYTYLTTFDLLSSLTNTISNGTCADDIDDCLTNPCMNGGTCEDRFGEYICHCPSGITDPNCYVPGLPTAAVGQSVTVSVGSTANIMCTVTGSVTSVFWQYQKLGVTTNIDLTNTTKYSGSTIASPSLSIHNVQISDVGNYRCLAVNSIGTGQSPTMAYLDISSSSSATSLLISMGSSVTSSAGSTVTLMCQVYGTVMSIQWQYEDTNTLTTINTANTAKYNNPTTFSPSLIIKSVTSSDSGYYRCVAYDITLRQAYGRIYLQVTSEAQVAGSMESCIQSDCPGMYDCQQTDGGSYCTLSTWKAALVGVFSSLGGAAVVSVTTFKLYHSLRDIDDCLTNPCMNGGTCEDRFGEYICHCPSGITDPNCYVPGLPTAEVGQSRTVSVGSTINIMCTVTGSVTSVFWQYQKSGVTTNIDLTNTTKYSGSTLVSPSLTIHNVQISDAGNYRCLAVNSIGIGQSPTMTYLDISGSSNSTPPSISIGSSVTSLAGSNVTLLCRVYGTVTSIQWQYEDTSTTTAIDTSNTAKYNNPTTLSPSLIIKSVTSSDSGYYRCVADDITSGLQAYDRIHLQVTSDAQVAGSMTPCIQSGCPALHDCQQTDGDSYCTLSTWKAALVGVFSSLGGAAVVSVTTFKLHQR